LLHGAESDRESRSGDYGDSETASDNSRCLKVAATATLAGISFDFGPSSIIKAHVGSMENYACYFPKGYGRPLAQSQCRSPARMKLLSSKIFSLLGSVCHCIQFMRTFYVNSEFNYTI
jgi:hypothetical protein